MSEILYKARQIELELLDIKEKAGEVQEYVQGEVDVYQRYKGQI